MPLRRLATGLTGALLALSLTATPAVAGDVAGVMAPKVQAAITVAGPAADPMRMILQRRQTQVPRWPPRLVSGAALQVRAGTPPAVLAAVRARDRARAAAERMRTNAGVRQWTERIGARSPPAHGPPVPPLLTQKDSRPLPRRGAKS